MDKNNNKTEEEKPDVNKRAAEEALRDLEKDSDIQPDLSESADLDEGELARKDNSND